MLPLARFCIINIVKLVIQRATRGEVSVNKKTVGQIEKGYVVLVGFRVGETAKNVKKMAEKLLNLRIMADEQGKMNLSIKDAKGELLLVPQFTLYADTSSRRPGFTPAAKREIASQFFEQFVKEVRKSGLKTETGQFGAYMRVEILNDGPVTIILEN